MVEEKEEVKGLTDSEILEIIQTAFIEFDGGVDELEAAIGALHIVQRLGWKPLLLMHSRKTFKKYETILGINFRETFPEVGKFAHKSQAWKAFTKIGQFWRAVKGEFEGVRSNHINK